MKTNYFNQFCKDIFGIAYIDQVHKDKEIIIWFEGNKIKTVTDDFIIEAINLNTNLKVTKLTDKSKDTDSYMLKDGYPYKIVFKNGVLYEKYIKETINKCALIISANN